MSSDEFFFGFREHLKVKGYAAASILHYRQHVKLFFAYLTDTGVTDPKRITRDALFTWQAHLALAHYAIATISLKVRAVKRFFAWLEETNVILINPAEYLKEPKKEHRLPKVILTDREVQKLLDQPNLGTLTGIRDRTILEVFYTTGIRLAELTHLSIYDVDLQGGFVRINKGKGAKDRVIPLGTHAVRFLKEYITRVRPQHTRKNKTIRTLFVSRFGTLLTRHVIDRMLLSYVKQAAMTKHVTPHTFRHTFATALVRNGADITAVSKMLGHSTCKVTQIYTRVAGVEVKKTHKKSHPREKDKDPDETPDTQGFYHAKPR